MCNSSGANACASDMSGVPADGGVPQCGDENPTANIVSVEFLNGDDNTEAASEVKHVVNMPRDAKWVDGTEVLNIDRLSKNPRIKVKFDRPGNHNFKIKLVPDGSNLVYTDAEKSRNTNFTFETRELDKTTTDNGNLILSDLFIAQGGNDIYKVQATDAQGTVQLSTSSIKLLRVVYYVEVKMSGLAGMAPNLNGLTSEFLNHHIKMLPLSSVEMPHLENISPAENATFESNVRTAFRGSDGQAKMPHCVAIAYTDHLAVKNPNQRVIKLNVDVGAGKPPSIISITGPGLTNPAIQDRYLWNAIVTGESWFVSCSFLKNGGDAATDTVVIPVEKCTLVATGVANMSRQISVAVDHLETATGSITINVNWVDRMRGGISFGGGNMICVCTKAWWQAVTAANQNQTLIHEMGHKVGMVATGSGSLPDRITTWYDDAKGHVGNHCHNGIPAGQARYDSNADVNLAICVMYGSNGPARLNNFCGNCAPAVKKIDISRGW